MNENFGFNLKAEDGVKFRGRTNCTVLPRDGFVHVMNRSEAIQPLLGRLNVGDFVFEPDEFELYLYGGWKNNDGITVWSSAEFPDPGPDILRITDTQSLLATNKSSTYTGS